MLCFTRRVAVIAVVALAVSGPAMAGLVTPWDALTDDGNASWIFPNTINMYAANTATEYVVGFSSAKSNGGARGMNSLRFIESEAAHHVTANQVGTFEVLVSGNENMADLLILVAFETSILPNEFSFSMGGYDFDANTDFSYYDEPNYATGRPTGYYSQTDPAGEPIAYDFDQGIVTVLALSNVGLTSNTPVTVSYAFENLPGRAVFSVYGLSDGGTEIYHTNRGVVDENSSGRGVSTFEVIPEPATLVLLCSGLVAMVRRRRC